MELCVEYNASPWVYVEHAICNGAIIDISNIDISNIDHRCISKLRRTSYSTAVMIGKTLHEHKSQSHQVWDSWHGIAEKNLAPTGLSKVGGYPSETHLNLKFRKFSLVNKIPFSLHMFLIFCTDHVSINHRCAMYKISKQLSRYQMSYIWANETSHDLSLRYVSDRYPMLHKDPDCDPEPNTPPKLSFRSLAPVRITR